MTDATTHYVTTNKQLKECITSLNQVDAFALDLEFDNNHYRYGFNICLMQIFDGTTCYLIDPLASGIDMKLIFPVMENEKIQKVVYAFGEDIRLLHSMACFPKNVYDLTKATALLDYAPMSLSALTELLLGIEAGKSAQRSNWYTRPLTENQFKYAAADVLYLIKMQGMLETQAIEKEVSAWIGEENAVFDEVSYVGVNDNNHIKEKEKKGLSAYAWHMHVALMNYRENIAKKFNKPSYQIIDKNYIQELVEDHSLINNWTHRKGMYRGIKNGQYQEEVRLIIKQAKEEAKTQHLSKTESATPKLSREEYNKQKKERIRREHVKNTIFKPIQLSIAEKYGENASLFILGNKLMLDLASFNTEHLRVYKKNLIAKCATELNLEVDPYL